MRRKTTINTFLCAGTSDDEIIDGKVQVRTVIEIEGKLAALASLRSSSASLEQSDPGKRQCCGVLPLQLRPSDMVKRKSCHTSNWFLFCRITQGCMNGFDTWRAFARWRHDQIIERIEADHARYEFDMRVYWLIRGTGCAAVGWVLLTILMR